MSLRSRFVAASSLVAIVTLSGAFTAVWFAYNTGQERQLDAALRAEAQQDALNASQSDGTNRLVLRREELGQITKYAVVYDSSGSALVWTANVDRARPGAEASRHPFGAPFDTCWSSEHLRAILVPVPGRQWSLLLATSRLDLDDDARDLARRMVLALLVAVFAGAVAMSWLARVLTRDHERITSVARAVAAGDLSARIGKTSGDPELVLLGRDVDEMISRLALLVETQQRFIANAAHELRSPVATLLGELSQALRRDRDAETYRQSIEESLSSARHLKVVTDDLLTLARMGAVEPELESVSLSDVTARVIEATQASADAKNVSPEVTCDGSTMLGNAGDLERLLRNLVENAIKHSPPEGRVRIDAHASAEHVEIVVMDDGPGVPPNLRERIFEPFFRAGEPHARDRDDVAGAGLGLAIARSIARAHGGDLSVHDSARGARFVARLPVRQAGTGGGS